MASGKGSRQQAIVRFEWPATPADCDAMLLEHTCARLRRLLMPMVEACTEHYDDSTIASSTGPAMTRVTAAVTAFMAGRIRHGST